MHTFLKTKEKSCRKGIEKIGNVRASTHNVPRFVVRSKVDKGAISLSVVATESSSECQ